MSGQQLCAKHDSCFEVWEIAQSLQAAALAPASVVLTGQVQRRV